MDCTPHPIVEPFAILVKLVPRFRSSHESVPQGIANFGIGTLVPLFDLKFLIELAAGGAGTSNGGTSHWASLWPHRRVSARRFHTTPVMIMAAPTNTNASSASS